MLRPIPDDVPAAVAAIVGCAVSTGLGAVWRTARVRPGERVAVIGCGGVGLSALLGASLAGATPIVAVDVSEAKLELAKQLGATASVVWRAGAEETADAIRDATQGGVDYAIEATGRPEAMRAAFLSTRPRGAAVLIGIPHADAVLTLPALSIPRRELRVMGSVVRVHPAGSRLPGDHRALPGRAAAARPAHHASAAATSANTPSTWCATARPSARSSRWKGSSA